MGARVSVTPCAPRQVTALSSIDAEVASKEGREIEVMSSTERGVYVGDALAVRRTQLCSADG